MDHLWELLTSGNVFLLGILTWILFHVGSAAAQNSPISHVWAKRIGFVVFLGFLWISLTHDAEPDETALISLAIRGLLAGWFAGTVVLTLLPVLLWCNELVWRQQMTLRTAITARRSHREAERQKRRAEADQHLRQKEWERTAPERERAQQEALEIAQLERQRKQQSQKRREDVRSQLELLYSLYAPKIQGSFTKAMLDDFEKTYMGDERLPEEVEERGKQLLAILEEHHRKVDPPKKYASMDDLAAWFMTEQKRLESLPLDEMLKDEFKAILHERYAELTQRFLQKLEP